MSMPRNAERRVHLAVCQTATVVFIALERISLGTAHAEENLALLRKHAANPVPEYAETWVRLQEFLVGNVLEKRDEAWDLASDFRTVADHAEGQAARLTGGCLGC